MGTELEPKQTVTETMDNFFAKQDGVPDAEPQEDSSTPTEQSETQPEDGSDPEKTPSTDESDSQKGGGKGFADHPAWKEREAKLKEAQAKLKDFESQNTLYSKLLDDPQVYAKWLKNQGFSEEQVRQSMADKGMTMEQPKTQETDGAKQAQAIAEKACKRLGWEIGKLTPEQVDYLKDHVSLTMAVMQDVVGEQIDQRIKPLEGFVNEGRLQQRLSEEEKTVIKMAKDEFPDLDWDKDLLPAMHRYLDALDQRDPQKKITLSYEDLYQRATRDLLKDLSAKKDRQEARDKVKENARPLTPGASIPRGKENTFKGKNASDTADRYLDSLGVR